MWLLLSNQDINHKLQPHQRAVAEAKARQSEPAAERDMLAQKHAAAHKAFQVRVTRAAAGCMCVYKGWRTRRRRAADLLLHCSSRHTLRRLF